MIFSLEEYENRYSKCQELMKESQVDLILTTKSSNIFYFSGYRTRGFTNHFDFYALLIPQSGEPTLIVPKLEKHSARKESWLDDIRVWGCDGCGTDPFTSLSSIFKEKKLLGSTIGTEIDTGQRLGMTRTQFEGLKQALPGCEFVNSTDITWKLRMVKSEAELVYMREATRITSCGYNALIEQAKVGMTERDMQKIVTSEMMRQGCEQEYFLSIGAGQARYSFMNPYPSDYATKKGDLVLMDWGAVCNGYWSDLTRVFAMGSISDRQKELYMAAIEMKNVARDAAQPGRPIADVDIAATKKAEELGVLEYMLHRTGHTLGLEVHEIPSISADDKTIMEPGMCLTIEPALYDWPDIGSFRIESIIAITEYGNETYDTCTTDLIIVDK